MILVPNSAVLKNLKLKSQTIIWRLWYLQITKNSLYFRINLELPPLRFCKVISQSFFYCAPLTLHLSSFQQLFHPPLNIYHGLYSKYSIERQPSGIIYL